MLVNAHGERFVDESSSYKKYLRQCKDPKHGGAFYYIFDEVGWELAHDSGTYDLSYYWLIEHKDIVEYENAEDLSRNSAVLLSGRSGSNAVASGEEDEFGRKNLPYLQTDRKMYAMRIEPGAYITLGGLHIDPEARVLRGTDFEHSRSLCSRPGDRFGRGPRRRRLRQRQHPGPRLRPAGGRDDPAASSHETFSSLRKAAPRVRRRAGPHAVRRPRAAWDEQSHYGNGMTAQ